MTNRNSTIDVAKGIGIILVVFGHNWIVLHDKSELFRIIFSFHMPLFFFLAGIYLRGSDELSHFLQVRASSLLKPYFVILTTVGVLKVLHATVLGELGQQQIDYFLGMIYGTGNTIIWMPMWFLPHLFITLAASLIILKASSAGTNSRAWVAISATVLLVVGIHFMDAFWFPGVNDTNLIKVSGLPGLPWSADLIPITSSLILFGYLVGERVKSMTFNAAAFVFAAALFASLHYYFDETIDLNSRAYGTALVTTIQAILGIYMSISVASFLQKYTLFRKSLGYIGAGSLFILVFHGVLQDVAFRALAKINPHVYLNGIASLAVGLVLPLLLLALVKRNEIAAGLLLPRRADVSSRHVE